jgi:hypothetical protein
LPTTNKKVIASEAKQSHKINVIASDRRERGNLLRKMVGLSRRYAPRKDIFPSILAMTFNIP